MDSQFAFQDIPLPGRQVKPRTNGLTMMIDWGIPLGLQEDLLSSQGLYIDEAKVAATIAGVLPRDRLRLKIGLYQGANCLTFPGGLFAELALAQGKYELFLEEARSLGFGAIEVSDNLLEISSAKKAEAIRTASRRFGFKVMGEIGRKEGHMSREELIADVENCLEAGASGALLEAQEIFHAQIRKDDIEALISRVPIKKILFELPVTAIPGITKSFKYQVLYWLVRTFGTEVNLANVEWDEVYFTEITRRGGAGETSHPEGAYRRAGISREQAL